MFQADIIILMSSFNGAAVLDRVLQGYESQSFAARSWRLVVVDNGSTDNTPDLLSRYVAKLPLSIILQPEPGKNRALNTALNQIAADLLVLTDDDAIPHAGFLEAWGEVVGARRDYSIFGGRITPSFEESPPPWLESSSLPFDVLFAARDLPSGPIPGREIFGPNMALRGSLVASGVRFNDAIGPNGADKNYPMGSETELCERLERGGEKCFFHAPPHVDHLVRRGQTSLSYIEGRARRSGRGEARRRLLAGSLSPTYASSGVRRWRREAGRLLREAGSRMPPSRLSLKLLWDRCWSQGFYEELALEAAKSG